MKKTVFLAVFLAVVLTACTLRSGVRLGYAEQSGTDRFSASYLQLDGSVRHTLRLPKEADYCLRVETASGSLDVTLEDAEGNCLFSQEDVQTGSYAIRCSGQVTLCLEGKGHRGSVAFAPEAQAAGEEKAG